MSLKYEPSSEPLHIHPCPPPPSETELEVGGGALLGLPTRVSPGEQPANSLGEHPGRTASLLLRLYYSGCSPG